MVSEPKNPDKNAESPVVSIIIPAFNDRSRLRLCLASLAKQEFDEPFEIIVADNGSTDGSELVADDFDNASCVVDPMGGSYAARRAGVVMAKGEYLAFTDSDCVPTPQWLAEGVKALRANPGHFVGGAIELFARDAKRPSAAEVWELVNAFPQQTYVEVRNYAATANMFVSRSDYERTGGFDADLMSGGDFEWGQRATQLGITGVYSASALVKHPCRQTLPELTSKFRRTYSGQQALKSTTEYVISERKSPLQKVASKFRNVRTKTQKVSPPTISARAKFILAESYISGARTKVKTSVRLQRRFDKKKNLAVASAKAERAKSIDRSGLLIYDADCGFCTKSAKWLSKRSGDRVRIASWQSLDLAQLGLTEEMVTAAAYWKPESGPMDAGSKAIASSLIANGGWPAALGRIIRSRPVSPIAHLVYRLVANNRHRMPGGTEACKVDNSSQVSASIEHKTHPLMRK